MKKKIFAMLLTLCTVMALLPTAAFAEEVASIVVEETPVIEVATAKELQDAVDYYDSVVVKLVADIVAVDSCALTVPSSSVEEDNNRYVSLDLNGHDISSNADCTIEVQQTATWDIYRDYNWLDIYGDGTKNNSDGTVAIRNYGIVTVNARQDEDGNFCSPEITGYVDNYIGEIMIYHGTFHNAVRSCIDGRGLPGRFSIEGNGVILNGGVTYNFTAEDIAESVTEKVAFISIIDGTVMGKLKAVGNATIEVHSGNFEQPVAEEYLADERVCVGRKDAEDETYYSVLKKTNRSISRISALLYTFWIEPDEVSQDFGSKSALTNKVADIIVGGVETFPTPEELYALENTTVNGKPVTIDYSSTGRAGDGSIKPTLEPGENKIEVKSKATDGTEYTFTFTLVLDAATENPDSKPETPPTPSKPTVPIAPSVPSVPTTGTVTKPDGSTVTTERDDNGSKSETVVDKNGMQTTEVTVSNAAVKEAVAAGEPMALPMPAATATKDSATAPTVTVDLPYNVKRATVEIPVENVTAGTVAAIVHADGTEEVVRTSVPTEDGIALSVENGATVKIIDNSRDFGDVAANHTFNDAIDFASARGIIEGYDNGSFAPGNLATSNAVVTVVSRIMGNDFYGSGATAKANDWAKENGITLGLDMSGNITRGSFMTMLWRAAGCPVSSKADMDFADASALNDIEKAAFAWAVENGVINGYGDGTVRPDAGITRGAMAAIAQRYMTAE